MPNHPEHERAVLVRTVEGLATPAPTEGLVCHAPAPIGIGSRPPPCRQLLAASAPPPFAASARAFRYRRAFQSSPLPDLILFPIGTKPFHSSTKSPFHSRSVSISPNRMPTSKNHPDREKNEASTPLPSGRLRSDFPRHPSGAKQEGDCPPLQSVVPSQRPSLREDDWVLWPPAVLRSRQ